MKTDVATLLPTDTIADAIRLMESRKIRHIPIITPEKHLIGLVTVSKIHE
ncbi:MAG: CBS domain-containing protein, partial [Bacillus sp. (in: firmicutes)]